ncbi:MAG: glutamate formimidoyltransferase [Anaerolineaceae bacterium]|nr:glutamate formimidoyltransferase [Anaerolineaceae bacterium]
MPIQIVECIPNFSEARREHVVDAILEAIRSVPGIHILDTHSDIDHNRTVVTFIGSPGDVEEAAYKAIAKAGELIDLEQHQGEHPRIGATDVVPFVPISGITMPECVEIARRLAKRVGGSLNIPVYLYEEAAICPERKNLEDIRRGEYETLKVAIATDPARVPDFGPSVVTGAGATVIGARQPLIAYNVYLTTTEVSIAEKIARRVRNSSGGFHFVKAMGVLVEGRAQVSMNLTNYKRSPMAQVTEMVRREAERYGVGIHHTELVGLIPNAALIDSARWYLQLDQFEPEQVLETRLFEGKIEPGALEETSGEGFLDALASGSPTPGGGSASAYTAAAGAALVTMVGRLTVGKSKYDDVQSEMWSLIEQAEILRKSLEEAVQKDAEAFEIYMQARRLPKNTDDQKTERAQAIKKATILAASVPLGTAQQAGSVLKLALRMTQVGNINAITDAGTAANLAYAAIKGAGLNVQVNLLGLEIEDEPARILSELTQVNKQADEMMDELKSIISTRGNLSL